MKGNDREKLKCLLQWIQVYQVKVQKQFTVIKWEEKRTSSWRESKEERRKERRQKRMRNLWSGEEGECFHYGRSENASPNVIPSKSTLPREKYEGIVG